MNNINNEIEIPYYLTIAFVVSIMLLLLLYGIFKHRIRKSWTLKSIFIFLGIYILVVGISLISDIYYQVILNEFDMNNNGIFEENEQNAEQQKAYRKFVNNTGRNLVVFTGFIYSFIISFPVYVIGLIVRNSSNNQKS